MAEEVVAIAKPNTTRRRAIEGAIGMLGGIVLACMNGPGLLRVLYSSPRGNTLCGDDVNDALAFFVKLQLTLGVLGGALLLLGSFFFRRMLRKRREATAASA